MHCYDLVLSYLLKSIENFKCSEKGYKVKIGADQSPTEDSPSSFTEIKEDLLIDLSARGYELLADKFELCLYHVRTLDELFVWVQEEMNFLKCELRMGDLLIPKNLEQRIEERMELLVSDLK